MSMHICQVVHELGRAVMAIKQHERGDDYSTIADKAGVSKETIMRWQTSNAPNLITFTACLEAMGYELEIR